MYMNEKMKVFLTLDACKPIVDEHNWGNLKRLITCNEVSCFLLEALSQVHLDHI